MVPNTDDPYISRVLDLARRQTEQCGISGETTPFTIVDLDRLRYQYQLWTEAMPSVKPFYAVKCNNDARIVSVLAEQGCGFDCASKGELQQILSLVPHSDIILAHPVKSRDCLRFAVDHNFYNMTFDSLPELIKMMEISCQIRPILRIRVLGFDSLINLNTKFGADEEKSRAIFQAAARMGVSIHGISFHIGSGVENCRPMARTLAYARKLFDYGLRFGHPLRLLDIGGGLVCTSSDDFMKLGRSIERNLRRNFGDLKVQVIAEPGRFFATDVQYAVVRVNHVGPASINEDVNSIQNVFVNDGVYGSFNYVLTEGRAATGIPLRKRPGTMRADIWGPTCCALDIIEKDRRISCVEEGDWLIYPQNGAYSNCLATTFNGFELPRRIYVDFQSLAKVEKTPEEEERILSKL